MIIKGNLVSLYCVCTVFTACHAILEDHKPLWPYGPSSCLGTGVLIVALCNPRTSLKPVDSVPVSCVSTGLQNFVASSCWCAAATGLNLCPYSKWRRMPLLSETAVDSSTVNPKKISHDKNVLMMCPYHVLYIERFKPVKRLGSALWFLESSVQHTHTFLTTPNFTCTTKTVFKEKRFWWLHFLKRFTFYNFSDPGYSVNLIYELTLF